MERSFLWVCVKKKGGGEGCYRAKSLRASTADSHGLCRRQIAWSRCRCRLKSGLSWSCRSSRQTENVLWPLRPLLHLDQLCRYGARFHAALGMAEGILLLQKALLILTLMLCRTFHARAHAADTELRCNWVISRRKSNSRIQECPRTVACTVRLAPTRVLFLRSLWFKGPFQGF